MPNPTPFQIIGQRASVPSNITGWLGYLNRDRWDDWGKYCTQFYLTIVDPYGSHHGIGQLKIGERGLRPHGASSDLAAGYRQPNIQSPFSQLGEEFFSVGQDDEYYSNLASLGDEVREWVLKCLRDVAFDAERWEWAKKEDVMGESLLRSVTTTTVEGQFRRMAHGDARLTRFDFKYSPPKRLGGDGAPPFVLDFTIDPQSPIPTNVHVLIGRNGVGKTRLLSLMAKALVATDAAANQSGSFEFTQFLGRSGGENFANVVAVSFSAFDEGDLLPERKLGPNGLGYSYIGLRDWTSESPTAPIKPKSPAVLGREFVGSLTECRIGARKRRWVSVIEILQSDPVFQSAQLTSLIEMNLGDREEREAVLKIFKALSSGHKIVLLTLTCSVESIKMKEGA